MVALAASAAGPIDARRSFSNFCNMASCLASRSALLRSESASWALAALGSIAAADPIEVMPLGPMLKGGDELRTSAPVAGLETNMAASARQRNGRVIMRPPAERPVHRSRPPVESEG